MEILLVSLNPSALENVQKVIIVHLEVLYLHPNYVEEIIFIVQKVQPYLSKYHEVTIQQII